MYGVFTNSKLGGWKELSNIMDLFERQGWINMDGQHIMSHNCIFRIRIYENCFSETNSLIKVQLTKGWPHNGYVAVQCCLGRNAA